jgi:hypothetical protein
MFCNIFSRETPFWESIGPALKVINSIGGCRIQAFSRPLIRIPPLNVEIVELLFQTTATACNATIIDNFDGGGWSFWGMLMAESHYTNGVGTLGGNGGKELFWWWCIWGKRHFLYHCTYEDRLVNSIGNSCALGMGYLLCSPNIAHGF